jgi:tetratricopeptide (TPR) repeat protein
MTMKLMTAYLPRLFLGTSLLAVGLSPSIVSAADCDPIVATAVSVQGKVDVRRVDVTQWQPVTLNDTFCTGDRIRVGDRSRADVALANQPVLRLDQNTTITLGGIQKEQTFLVDLVQGATYFFSRATRALDVRTAFVNAGVEGTEGLIRVGDDRTEITIFEGKVVAANDAGTLSLTGGESAVAIQGQAPAYRTILKPRDAVQWALYYPPVMEIPPDDFAGRETNDPRVLAGRAAASLTVGRVDEASADLERALQLDPRNSEALALQSIIAITQNDKEKGMALAQQAVQANPQSTTAHIAKSYAEQAHFNLDGAKESLLAAVKANPNDALAWARLAEIHMSFQEMDKALEAAKKATELNPNLARTQTVLGFAYLMQVKTGKAREAFNKAHELDQGDALPMLGLGLAKMRDGEVAEGRGDLEIAATLDPNNAMVRSYLGKAYFEEKRDDLTEREYATAKELDPKDPTPFFYDALQKQLTNRPVEALEDFEKAIDLNDNRAVYQSKLSLDSDLAARSSSLGRIYSNLGFQQAALVEGWTSVNKDQTSFTAHRFLADSYSVLNRHEIARVSELLQSQLLQPINITPLQPSLAVSNLFLLSSLGPESTSFNEFNTLMVNRDRLTVLGSGLVGQNDTHAGEAVVAGIYQNLSFSGGWSTFNTDGFRKNADQDDDNGNFFTQLEISPRTSFQFEYRYRKLTRGDQRLRFFKDDFFPGLEGKEKRHTVRVGGRHEFSPGSIVLGSFIYADANFKDTLTGQNPPVNFIEIKQPQDGYTVEGQHLFRSQYLNLTTGAGYFDINGKQKNTLDLQAFCAIPVPFPPFCLLNIPASTIVDELDTDVNHTNVYGYSYIKPFENLTLTLGVSADFVNADQDVDGDGKNQVNPKFGIIWNPFPGTTIRGAAFRTLKRSLIANQTIEPTQVAGFNQFFDDFNATDAWRYGGAINQKLPHRIYVGAEFSYRNLDSPYIDATNPNVTVDRKEDQDEYLALGYLFWTPFDWVALRSELVFERLQTEGKTDQPQELNTYRVPLGISVFHPSGLSAFVTGTYWDQDGTFVRSNSSIEKGSDNFWTVNAGLNYRLPKRYGLLTVGVTNLTDKDFKFFDRDISNPMIQPDRMVFGKLTLALP